MEIKMWRGPGPHPTFMTSETGDRQFCTYSYCRGECGHPALFLRDYVDSNSPRSSVDAEGRHYYDYKANDPSRSACGRIWQARLWDGERVYLEEDAEEVKRMIRDHYWPDPNSPCR